MPKERLLFVDDEPLLLRTYVRAFGNEGYDIETAPDGEAAAGIVAQRGFDVIVSDISMPGMSGLQLLRAVRARDLDVPVILITGAPSIESAMAAIENGAFRLLAKPFDMAKLVELVGQATRLHRLARARREAFTQLGLTDRQVGDRAGLEVSFERALDKLWLARQPIVDWPARTVLAHEVLLRSHESTLPTPMALLSAAERLGRLPELGRAVRDNAAKILRESPPATTLFVNLHSSDLLDESLFDPAAALSTVAANVVLEITERASMDEVKDSTARIAALRKLGFRIAIDDLGAGYAGLSSFATLEPEVAKLDMSLVRDLHKEPIRHNLVRSMVTVCRELNILVIAEGVETAAERDALDALGCQLMQGYLFAKPAPAFPVVAW